jgi:hypothetical protein
LHIHQLLSNINTTSSMTTDLFTSWTSYMAWVKSTVRKVSLSTSHQTTSAKSQSEGTSSTSGVRRKWLISNMDTLAIHPTAHDTAHDVDNDLIMNLTNDDGPIAIRDWLDGCIPPPLIAQVDQPSNSSRSRTRRRLLTQDDDSDGSQEGKPSPASSSKAIESMRTGPQSLDPERPESSLLPKHPTIQLSTLASQPTPSSQPSHAHVPQPTASSTSAPPNLPCTTAKTSAPTHPVNPPLVTTPPLIAPVTTVNHVDFVHHLWYSFSVHELLNVQLGLPEYHTFGASTLAESGMPASEVQEFLSCRHSFPHVPQRLLPSVRPDGIPDQYLHLTQIPQGIPIDSITGLSHSYQILIRFDFGYNEMSKVDVQEAAIARFEEMNIPLSTRYREPVSALIHPHTKKWLGFLKVDLLNPNTDGIALLKGDRLFILQLQDLNYMIGKIEKGFDFPSTAANRRLHLESPILARYAFRNLLGELIRLGYLCGANLEFIGVSKRTKEMESSEITVASAYTKRYLLESPILIANHRISISLPAETAAYPHAPKALSTSIIVKGLPVDYAQNQITAALHKLLRPKNILHVTYNRASDDSLGHHDGVATIRCLNATVYTHWCNRREVPLLGKLVDFSPHTKSLAGTNPSAVAKAQDRRPTREVIAEAITAFKNDSTPAPTFDQLTAMLQQVETRLTTHMSAVGEGINLHTSAQVDAANTQQLNQHAAMRKQLQLLTSASRDYSTHMSSIFSALNSEPAEGSLGPHELPPTVDLHD